MDANLFISSNLMIDDDEHKPEWRFIPGDYVGAIYPEVVDSRNADRDLSVRQQVELKQYLVCLICRRPCAGTCEKRKGRRLSDLGTK